MFYRTSNVLFPVFNDTTNCLHTTLHLFLNKTKMLGVKKRKHVHKTLRKKCQALKDTEKRLPSKDVAGANEALDTAAFK